MICEVQVRVSEAPDDHILYEIRRNFEFVPLYFFACFFGLHSSDSFFYTICFLFGIMVCRNDTDWKHALATFCSQACHFPFPLPTKGTQLTVCQKHDQPALSISTVG